MKTRSQLGCVVGVTILANILLSTVCVAKNYDSQDIIFRGPWSFVETKYQGKDVVIAIAPYADDHDLLVAGPSPQKKLNPGLYVLTLPSSTQSTSPKPPAKYLLFSKATIAQSQLDKIVQGSVGLSRFVIILPPPKAWSGAPSEQIATPDTPQESDLAETWPVPFDAGNRGEYSTGIALRYYQVSLSGVTLTGTPEGAPSPQSFTFNPKGDFTLDISPSTDDTDWCHYHAKAALAVDRCLIGTSYFVDLAPYPTTCRIQDPQDPKKGLQCPKIRWQEQLLLDLDSLIRFLLDLNAKGGDDPIIRGLEKAKAQVKQKSLRDLSDNEWEEILAPLAALEKKVGLHGAGKIEDPDSVLDAFLHVKSRIAIVFYEDHRQILPFGVMGHDCKAPMLQLTIK